MLVTAHSHICVVAFHGVVCNFSVCRSTGYYFHVVVCLTTAQIASLLPSVPIRRLTPFDPKQKKQSRISHNLHPFPKIKPVQTHKCASIRHSPNSKSPTSWPSPEDSRRRRRPSSSYPCCMPAPCGASYQILAQVRRSSVLLDSEIVTRASACRLSCQRFISTLAPVLSLSQREICHGLEDKVAFGHVTHI